MSRTSKQTAKAKKLKADIVWLHTRIIDPRLADWQVEAIRKEIKQLQRRLNRIAEPVLLADILPEVIQSLRVLDCEQRCGKAHLCGGALNGR